MQFHPLTPVAKRNLENLLPVHIFKLTWGWIFFSNQYMIRLHVYYTTDMLIRFKLLIGKSEIIFSYKSKELLAPILLSLVLLLTYYDCRGNPLPLCGAICLWCLCHLPHTEILFIIFILHCLIYVERNKNTCWKSNTPLRNWILHLTALKHNNKPPELLRHWKPTMFSQYDAQHVWHLPNKEHLHRICANWDSASLMCV